MAFLSMKSKFKIPEKFIHQLVKLPESGMGYQLVKIFLVDGKILRKRKLLNSSILVLDPDEDISSFEIEKIELDR
ncbi:MAG: hypothetical protein ABIR03_01350 [Ginsengibacter sp.]